MTKDEAFQLGIRSQETRAVFQMHCQLSTPTDPAEREAQIKSFEMARANWHDAMNRHHAALQQLGLLPNN